MPGAGQELRHREPPDLPRQRSKQLRRLRPSAVRPAYAGRGLASAVALATWKIAPRANIAPVPIAESPAHSHSTKGAEVACDAESLCRPFESTDPPHVNVGICTPAGEPADPGFGAACIGPCAGAMDCVAGELASGGAACASTCDPTGAASCPAGSGCAPELSATGVYLGYGYCRPIGAGQAAVGEDCSGSIACQAGTECVPPLTTGHALCAVWCDPFASNGCGSDGCAFSVTPGDEYADIGACLPNPPNARTLGESCSVISPCGYPTYCAALPSGELVCQALCDPWAPTCAAGTGCLPLLTTDLDYHGAGVCGPVLPDAISEFALCDASTQNCAAGPRVLERWRR